ncbi:MAG: ABC transporter substrate-binding protein [Pseudomonadota bacterium]
MKVCIALAVAGMAFAPALVATAQDPIHIGVLAPLSGPFAQLGEQVEIGVRRATESLNIRITALDDACDEDRGLAAANQFVGAQVDFVVGGVCWRPAVSARAVLETEGIPFYASGVRFGGLTDQSLGDTFRVNGRDDTQAAFLSELLLSGALDAEMGRELAAANPVLLFTDGTYGRTLAEGMRDILSPSGIDFALFESFDPQTGTDRAAARAEAEDPALIIIFAGQADTALMVSALRSRGVASTILAGDSALAREFPLLAQGREEGILFSRPVDWRWFLSPEDRTALEQDGSSLAGLVLPSMAATQVGLAVQNGQLEWPFGTVLGPITFDDNGDANLPSFELWEWRQGVIWRFGEVPEDLDLLQ